MVARLLEEVSELRRERTGGDPSLSEEEITKRRDP